MVGSTSRDFSNEPGANGVIENLRKYWWLITVILGIVGGLVAFGGRMSAIAETPQRQDVLEDRLAQYWQYQQEYVMESQKQQAVFSTVAQQNSKMIELLTQRALRPHDGG